MWPLGSRLCNEFRIGRIIAVAHLLSYREYTPPTAAASGRSGDWAAESPPRAVNMVSTVRWPHESPAHAWLRSDNDPRSTQQRQRWYAATKKLTGLDLGSVATDDPQLGPLINDAVALLEATRIVNQRLESF